MVSEPKLARSKKTKTGRLPAGVSPPSARIPNLPGIVGGALVGPGGVDELGEIGARAPVEVELGARIVEPVGMIGAGDVDRAQALRRLEMSGDGGSVEGLVHRDGPAFSGRCRRCSGRSWRDCRDYR